MLSEPKAKTASRTACPSLLLPQHLRSAPKRETETNWCVQASDSLELNPFPEKRTGGPKPLIPGKMIVKCRKYSFNGAGLRSMNCAKRTARQRAEPPFNLCPGSIGDSGPRTMRIKRSRNVQQNTKIANVS